MNLCLQRNKRVCGICPIYWRNVIYWSNLSLQRVLEYQNSRDVSLRLLWRTIVWVSIVLFVYLSFHYPSEFTSNGSEWFMDAIYFSDHRLNLIVERAGHPTISLLGQMLNQSWTSLLFSCPDRKFSVKIVMLILVMSSMMAHRPLGNVIALTGNWSLIFFFLHFSFLVLSSSLADYAFLIPMLAVLPWSSNQNRTTN